MKTEVSVIVRFIYRDGVITNFYIPTRLASSFEEAEQIAQDDLTKHCPLFPGVTYTEVNWPRHLGWNWSCNSADADDIKFKYEGHNYMIRYLICPRYLTT